MATLREERARLQFLEEHGHGDEKVHVVFVKEEVRKRVQNKGERTRLIKELDTPEAYSDWEAEWDRWIQGCGGHKPIAQDLMLRHLQQVPLSEIAKFAEDEQEEPAGLGNHG